MKADNKSRYSLAKTEVSQFLKQLKIPKFETRKMSKSVKHKMFSVFVHENDAEKREMFSVFVYENNVDIEKISKDILKHNFEYSDNEGMQYCMAGVFFYFAVN